jgi:hypothetical protein
MSLEDILIMAGGIVIALWGVAHIAPTRAVVAGFGAISLESRRILTMEWIAEGLTLCFVGALSLIVVLAWGADGHGTRLVSLSLAALLLVMAGLTQSTGARTSVLPIKLCPIVKCGVAALFVDGSLL